MTGFALRRRGFSWVLPVRVRRWIVQGVALFIVALVLFEFLGQWVFFRDKLYFVNDVDHRMKPHSAPDINGDGIRSLREREDFHAPGHNVLFLGDSFVHGYRLPLEESVPHLLEGMANAHRTESVRVANMGWISSSPYLSLRLLEDLGAAYQPDVVLFALDMSDFEDDAKYRRLIERPGIYRHLDTAPITLLALKQILRKTGPLQPLHERVFGYPARRFFVTAGPREEYLPYYEEVRRNIEAMHRYTTEELGARFFLFLFPRSYQYSERESPRNWEARHYEALGPYALEPFAYFDDIQDELPFPVISLLGDFQRTEVFPTCYENDPHWTAAGSQVAAEAVYRACLREGCFRGERLEPRG